MVKPCFSQKQKVSVEMRSLIKNELFESDLTLKRASSTVEDMELLSTGEHWDCFWDRFDQFTLWAIFICCCLVLSRTGCISEQMGKLEGQLELFS